jgi:hypothetical protein
MVMEGKKNPYDPAELFKQWLEKTSQAQSDFAKNVNPFQTNFQKSIQSAKYDTKLSLMGCFQN